MKIAKRIAISLLIFLLLIFLAGMFIARFYGKEVARYAIAEISKNVNTEINVGEVENLSLFKKFPFASLVLYDVLIKEVAEKKTNRDTLLYMKKIYLQFNLVDILRGNYKIKRINATDGFIKLTVDKNGKENYLIQSKEEKESESFLLKLTRLSISNVDVFYENEIKEEDYHIRCSEAIVKGNFSDEKYMVNIEGDFFSEHLKTEDTEFLSQRELNIKSELNVDKTSGIYSLRKGEFIVDKNTGFDISGSIVQKENSSFTDLQITAKNINIVNALELLPQKYKKSFSDYESKGNITFSCKINGEMSNVKTPAITASFSVTHGTVKHKSTSYSLQNVELKGSYSNGKNQNPASSVIMMEDFNASLGNGNIHTKFRVKNLNNPQIKLSAVAKLQLEDLRQFIKIDTIENISGVLDVDASYEGVLKNKEDFTAQDFRNSKSSGTVNFQNVNFALKNSPLSYRNFSGNLLLQNNDVLIKEAKGNVSSSDFELNGLFRNALAYLFMPEEKLTVEAAFNSNNLNLNELLADNGQPKSDSVYVLAFPARVNFNMNTEIGHLSFRKFNAANMEGVITIQEQRLRSENISFNTMDGSVSANLEIDASSKSAILISSGASVKNIDISKLFYDFENFGQNVITDKHLKGAASADIHFAMALDSTLKPDDKKIYTVADLTIEKGELVNFEPLNDVSGYIKKHPLLKRIIKADEFEKKLQHVYFSTLQNRIEIADRKITIPVMTINSSAMQIEAEGTHSFDNEIDYKINFFLSELLTKRENVTQEEFGEVEDDGSGKKKIFLTVTGTVDKPVITYDKKKVKKKIKEDVQQEKKLVKGILKEELGWFKKDTTAIHKKKEPKEDFAIEWEESKKPAVDSSGKQLKTDSSKAADKKVKNIKKLLDKLKKEDSEKKEDFEMEKEDDF